MSQSQHNTNNIIIRDLGEVDYLTTLQAMQHFTEKRTETTSDELWLCSHPPVFTLGMAGLDKHLLQPTPEIPVHRTDRGGQITYHGPGQLIIYTLIDLKRGKYRLTDIINSLEQCMVNTLANHNIPATTNPSRRGVYVNDAKIGAIGLKIRANCSYHGLAFNYNVDIKNFSYINPCGYPDLAIANFYEINKTQSASKIHNEIANHLCEILNKKK